jgi:hypothetical protein
MPAEDVLTDLAAALPGWAPAAAAVLLAFLGVLAVLAVVRRLVRRPGRQPPHSPGPDAAASPRPAPGAATEFERLIGGRPAPAAAPRAPAPAGRCRWVRDRFRHDGRSARWVCDTCGAETFTAAAAPAPATCAAADRRLAEP